MFFDRLYDEYVEVEVAGDSAPVRASESVIETIPYLEHDISGCFSFVATLGLKAFKYLKDFAS
jgi:hypothetical protein